MGQISKQIVNGQKTEHTVAFLSDQTVAFCLYKNKTMPTSKKILKFRRQQNKTIEKGLQLPILYLPKDLLNIVSDYVRNPTTVRLLLEYKTKYRPVQGVIGFLPENQDSVYCILSHRCLNYRARMSDIRNFRDPKHRIVARLPVNY